MIRNCINGISGIIKQGLFFARMPKLFNVSLFYNFLSSQVGTGTVE